MGEEIDKSFLEVDKIYAFLDVLDRYGIEDSNFIIEGYFPDNVSLATMEAVLRNLSDDLSGFRTKLINIIVEYKLSRDRAEAPVYAGLALTCAALSISALVMDRLSFFSEDLGRPGVVGKLLDGSPLIGTKRGSVSVPGATVEIQDRVIATNDFSSMAEIRNLLKPDREGLSYDNLVKMGVSELFDALKDVDGKTGVEIYLKSEDRPVFIDGSKSRRNSFVEGVKDQYGIDLFPDGYDSPGAGDNNRLKAFFLEWMMAHNNDGELMQSGLDELVKKWEPGN